MTRDYLIFTIVIICSLLGGCAWGMFRFFKPVGDYARGAFSFFNPLDDWRSLLRGSQTGFITGVI